MECKTSAAGGWGVEYTTNLDTVDDPEPSALIDLTDVAGMDPAIFVNSGLGVLLI